MNPEPELEPELAALEQQLRKLEPAQPSDDLEERIFSAFETPADAAPAPEPVATVRDHDEHSSWFQPFAAAAAIALVAGIVVFIGMSRPDSSTGGEQAEAKASGDVIKDAVRVTLVPSSAQNIYEGSELGEVVFTEGKRPVQPLRHQFTNTYIWRNPEDGSLVEMRIPVERVRYIPVPTD